MICNYSRLIMDNFIDYINRYTTVSSEHEAAFDEYLSTAKYSPKGGKLQLKTKVEDFVQKCFSSQEHPPSIILTGNAGDGKTYLCRKIIESFNEADFDGWSDNIDWPIEQGDLTLHIVKDLSELDETSGAEVLKKLAKSYSDDTNKNVYLVAANEGRLRKLLSGKKLETLYIDIDAQLKAGPDLESKKLIVINLNRITTSTYVPQFLAWLTNPAHWHDTNSCMNPDNCPIHYNVQKLRDKHVQTRIQLLYRILERIGIHITIRDMLIHLAFTVTAGRTCEEFAGKTLIDGAEPHEFVYFENIVGETASPIAREKIAVLKHFRTLNLGFNSVYELDDFIINGDASEEENKDLHQKLFVPALDIGGKRFTQDRDVYLRGTSTITKAKGDPPFLSWLPHCRRKLFFEWEKVDLTNRLFLFLHLPEYFKLLESKTLSDRDLELLVLGLNRTFTGLFINDSSHLYLTSQYADTVEQQVPIIQVKLPIAYIYPKVVSPEQVAYDCNYPKVIIEIYPPPKINAESIVWTLDLLSFEYLMRRAKGGTPNVLASECELEIRQLKNKVLDRFVVPDVSDKKIEFFFDRE